MSWSLHNGIPGRGTPFLLLPSLRRSHHILRDQPSFRKADRRPSPFVAFVPDHFLELFAEGVWWTGWPQGGGKHPGSLLILLGNQCTSETQRDVSRRQQAECDLTVLGDNNVGEIRMVGPRVRVRCGHRRPPPSAN